MLTLDTLVSYMVLVTPFPSFYEPYKLLSILVVLKKIDKKVVTYI